MNQPQFLPKRIVFAEILIDCNGTLTYPFNQDKERCRKFLFATFYALLWNTSPQYAEIEYDLLHMDAANMPYYVRDEYGNEAKISPYTDIYGNRVIRTDSDKFKSNNLNEVVIAVMSENGDFLRWQKR